MNKRLTTEQFIGKAIKVHGHRYNYESTIYTKSTVKVKINCLIHGDFTQYPFYHLDGNGCQSCSKIRIGNGRRLILNDFLEKSKLIHGERYSYDTVDYVNSNTKVEIICEKHGSFYQTPKNHFSGKGCPICRCSKGELEIRNFLIENNIEFEVQKRFIDCRDIRELPFDFFISKFNLLIEYDGKQHFTPISKYEKKNGFKQTKKHDLMKYEYAKLKNMNFLRIPYFENTRIILNNHFQK